METTKIKHIKWPSIERFHKVYKDFKKYRDKVRKYHFACEKPILYTPMVKLHGTNAGITFTKEKYVAQSRNRIISVDKDNQGFAKWLKETGVAPFLKGLFAPKYEGSFVTIFGEFCGQGILKGAAICEIDKKVFCPFGVVHNGKEYHFFSERQKHEMRESGLPIFPLDFMHNWSIRIDFTKRFWVKKAVDRINSMVEKVEKEDPFVKDNFGISGVGEGLVFYPMNTFNPFIGVVELEILSAYMFKAKGEKHKVNQSKSKKPVTLEPEQVKEVEEFVEMFVTENRLQQGLHEVCEGNPEKVKTGEFIGWVCKDVHKESESEREECDIEWKRLNKAVTNKARNWFLNKCDRL